MISEALALAILTTTGFYIIWTKLPPTLKAYLLRWELGIEIGTLALAYILLGGTLTALFSASVCGLLVSVLLYIHKHPDDFTYLQDIQDNIDSILKQIQEKLCEWGRNYRQRKEVYEGITD